MSGIRRQALEHYFCFW